jgi:Flp pilus assembly protein TadD
MIRVEQEPKSSDPGVEVKRRDLWRDLLVVLALWVVTGWAFRGVLDCDFVSYDDPSYVTHHPMVNQGLRPAAIEWAFTAAHSSNWNPVTSLSHMLDVTLFGLKAKGHHGVNLLLHALNAALVYGVWCCMSGARWPAVLAAGLFALHPLHVESVAWISQRKDLLSTLFWLLALWGHAGYARVPSWWRRILVWVWCALALMAKPMAVTLPVTLLLVDFWPLARWPQRSWWQLVREKAPLFLMCGGHTLVTVLAQQADGAMDFNRALPLGLRLSNAAVSCVRYLGRMIWPADLSPFYPYPEFWPTEMVIGAVAGVMVLTWMAWRGRVGRPWRTFGWGWYLVTLLPVIGIVQTGAHAMADRYTYVPLLGLFWLAAGELDEWRYKGGRLRRASVSILAGVLLTGCGWLSMRQVEIWTNADRLLGRMREVAGEHPVIFRERALLLQMRGASAAEVEAEYRRGLSAHPDHVFFLLELSLIEARAGRFAEAKSLIERARGLDPGNPGWQFNLGSIEMLEGRTEGAIETLRAGLKAHPGVSSGFGLIGRMRLGQGRIEEAVEAFQQAIESDRWDWLSQNELGVALFQAGRKGEALAAIERAHWINPGDPGIVQNLNEVRKAMSGNAPE